MTALRTLFRWWMVVMLALVVLQIAFAGYGAFDTADKVSNGTVDEQSFEDSFGLHIGFGYLVILGGLLTFVFALVARVGRPRVLHALGIFGLLILQLLLAWTGAAVPGVFGALHPLNAFVILGAVAALTMRMWREPIRETAPEAAPATSPPTM
jgi:heme A synthase